MRITVNNQPYTDWASIPAEYRTKLVASQTDSDGSGVPDVFEGDGEVEVTIEGDSVSVSSHKSSSTSTSTSTSVSVGGQDVTGFFKRLFKR
jgi:hypothetical protein